MIASNTVGYQSVRSLLMLVRRRAKHEEHALTLRKVISYPPAATCGTVNMMLSSGPGTKKKSVITAWGMPGKEEGESEA